MFIAHRSFEMVTLRYDGVIGTVNSVVCLNRDYMVQYFQEAPVFKNAHCVSCLSHT